MRRANRHAALQTCERKGLVQRMTARGLGGIVVALLLVAGQGCTESLHFEEAKSEANGGTGPGSAPPTNENPSQQSSPFSCNETTSCSVGTCDLDALRCVECVNNDDCGSGEQCHPISQRCVLLCDDNDPCRALGFKGCDKEDTGEYCTECHDDGHCAGRGAARFCDRTDGRCVECRADTDCPAERPRCDERFGRCRSPSTAA